MSIDEVLDEIATVAPPQTPGEASILEECLARILALGEPMTKHQMDRLFGVLSDSSPYQDVLWSVLQTIEAQGSAVYVDGYARNLSRMCENEAMEWAETMACRILNGSLEDELFSRIVAHGSQARSSLQALLQPVAAGTSSVALKAAEVVQRLKQV